MSGILRLIAGGLLALICCYIGVLIKRRYLSRAAFFKDALLFSRQLKGELSFKKTPIPDIVDSFCEGKSGEICAALNECVKRLKSGQKDMTGIKISVLKGEEQKEFLAYLAELGGSELSGQLALAGRLEAYALAKAEKCEDESKRLGGMYFRLCVLLGLAIILILA